MSDYQYENLNLLENVVSDISPEEFEILCFNVLQEYAIRDNLKDFSITHNEKIKKNDEEYQIDVYAEFFAMNVKFKIIVECKHKKRPIERDEVILLNDKVKYLSAHKGILISTSGYQKGALQRADEHGIALIQIVDKFIYFIKASLLPIDDIKREFEKQYPSYLAMQYANANSIIPTIKLYPTEKMEELLKQELFKKFNIS